jgi:hypothetical protein
VAGEPVALRRGRYHDLIVVLAQVSQYAAFFEQQRRFNALATSLRAAASAAAAASGRLDTALAEEPEVLQCLLAFVAGVRLEVIGLFPLEECKGRLVVRRNCLSCAGPAGSLQKLVLQLHSRATLD